MLIIIMNVASTPTKQKETDSGSLVCPSARHTFCLVCSRVLPPTSLLSSPCCRHLCRWSGHSLVDSRYMGTTLELRDLDMKSDSIDPFIVSCVSFVWLLSYSGLISTSVKVGHNNNTHLRIWGK